MLKILVLHGPNLNLLGQREVNTYGFMSLAEINSALKHEAKRQKVQIVSFQSNHEGELVDRIGGARKKYDGILINPAAYTHTSVAIRDALAASDLPAVEVHLSAIFRREEFRHHSLTAPACIALVAGFGSDSYVLGLEGLIRFLRAGKKSKRL